MDRQKVTKIVVLAVVALIIVYDVIAWRLWGVQATISRITLGWARQWPVVPFCTGVVCGHLFWPQNPSNDKQ